MPRIYLCFVWHMHQPYYKDLVSGEYKLPWTRMHALKDYYGMVHILGEFPKIRQTFNLVPSMMAQVAEYAAGEAVDSFLELALKPAESLTDADRAFLLRHSFYSDPQRMIYRYPRYGELFDAWQAQRASGRVLFGVQDFRDLQMWSQLAWFDEDFQENDPEVREWIRRGRDFTPADQRRMGEKQRDLVGLVLPEYRARAAAGQIEISTTPYYHPILPLLCDSDIAAVSHPGVSLPPRFRYPGDARRQLVLAREYVTRQFGAAPAGLWPSEGSVSDEVFGIAAETGFSWAATDSGVLGRTLNQAIGVDRLYRPFQWRQGGRSLGVIFRDHLLSDLIGFVYSKMDAVAAADDFLRRIRDNCAGILSTGRDALAPIILDGENAWEYYDRNGRPFFRELYRRISEDDRMAAVTVSEAFKLMPAEPLDHIFPGSWINANFDVWIGAEEDNQAWTQLLRARETFDQTAGQVDDPSPANGVGRTADRRGQRLVLVVRPGARFRQPPRVRPALPQPPGQRLPLSEPDAARGVVAAHSAHLGAGRAHRALGAHHSGDRWRRYLVFRMAGRRHLSRGRALGLDARQEIPGEGSAIRNRRFEFLSAHRFPRRL